MKHPKVSFARFVVSSLLFFMPGGLPLNHAQEVYKSEEMEGGNIRNLQAVDDLSPTLLRSMQAESKANIEKLEAEGRLKARSMHGPVRFVWPMKRASGLRLFSLGLVVSYVDQNPLFPGQILDWNCGMRTYDGGVTPNHTGTDIVSQPFPWRRMARNEAYAVAAARGVLVQKVDGIFDQNCTVGSIDANRIAILHDDDSTTRYLHLKSGSLTSKEIGDSVEAGEYLGVVGSSGSSSIPHVHFQVNDSATQLQDPYMGACNSMNSFSWWEDQEPYNNSQILALSTGGEPPIFPPCPQEEISNEKIVFQPGDQLVTTAFYRDQLTGDETTHTILRPDGSVFTSWLHVSPATYNFLRYWFRTWQIPPGAPLGRWTYRSEYRGEIYETNFYVGQPADVSVSGRVTTLTGRPVSGAVVSLSRDGAAPKVSRTNPFGYYRIDEVPVGETFDVNVLSKQLTFLPRTTTIGGQLADFDLFSLNDY